jgi:lipopolysaccharide export system protein LptA
MPSPSGLSTKTIGLITAALLTLVFTIIIWISISGAQPAQPVDGNGKNLFDHQDEIPDIGDARTGGEMLVTMVDKNDPTRIAATLQADRFEPMGEGRRRLDNPISWIYTRDGRAVRVSANYATMLMPDPNQPPDSGTLEGDIRIEVFNQVVTAGTPLEEGTNPNITVTFDEPVEFERRYLRLRSGGHFDIVSDQFDFSGADLTVILNELRDRVELIDVMHGDRLVIHTDPAAKAINSPLPNQNTNTQDEPQSTVPATNQTTTQNPTVTAEASKEDDSDQPTLNDIFTRYHVTLLDQVIATVGDSGNVNADTLELWAELNDGALPENAIKQISFAETNPDNTTLSSSPDSSQAPKESFESTSSSHQNITNTDSSNGWMNAQGTTESENNQNSSNPNKDIIITWSGKMTVRPIDDTVPPELINDAISLRFSAAEGKGIAFSSAQPGKDSPVFTGKAASATYHATQAVLKLDSSETIEGLIELDAPGQGALSAVALQANLSTGHIALEKRGKITSTPSANAEDHASIEWANSASFDLAIIDKQLTNRLDNAFFDGRVVAKQDGNSLGAGTLNASFDPTLTPEHSLTRIELTTGVLSSASRSLLSGKQLDIDFAPSIYTDSVDPIRLFAKGQVLGRNPESMLKADELTTEMYRNLAGDLNIESASARGNIRYTGPNQTSAKSETLQADGINEIVTLKSNSPDMVGMASVAQAGSSIEGNHIILNTKRRGIEVIGPGTFDHDILIADSDQSKGHIRTSWDGSMRFDDALGSIVCEENVRVVSTPDAYTRDTLEAHRAEINLTPVASNDPIDPIPDTQNQKIDIADAQSNDADQERQLISAKIYGRAPFGQDPVPAKIESRIYAQDNPQLAISLIYLEGPQIIADNIAQTLDVPTAGTLLIMDKSAMPDDQDADQSDDTNPNQAPSLAGSGPALTRFTWAGNMNLNRSKGKAVFNEQVMVRQKSIETGKVSQLQTDQLSADFDIGEQSQSEESTPSTRLLSASALGNVRFIFEGRELLADNATYDAIQDSLFASAVGNKLVTLYSDDRPTPLSARTMSWDLTKDRVIINAPSPTRSQTGG